MASKACAPCLRVLRRQSRLVAQRARSPISLSTPRAFTTTSQPAAKLFPGNGAPRRSRSSATTGHGEAPGKRLTPEEEAAKATLIGGIKETYTAYGMTDKLFRQCAVFADYEIPQARDPGAVIPQAPDGTDLGVAAGPGWWHDELGLKPTFTTWATVTMLHMYLLHSRFRCFPHDIAKLWQQHICDHFFYEAEGKLADSHLIESRSRRNTILKDVNDIWRGAIMAYDEGLCKNDAFLASAIWRNIFQGDENADIQKLAMIVAFMRRSWKQLDELGDIQVMTAAVTFGSPELEASLVALRSRNMNVPLSNKPLEEPSMGHLASGAKYRS